ncbi:hypothetical protein EXIGLDRAFT_763737 [Exidia glandulosa HHB12029]|uniref:DUF6533 domain-containing protein n=1 Tax=Exidia glandulosa HHB12029 TaxID=1314781 RepID=A0A165LS98_EXIGL|nr:hypothetical protein EXIGLDRAFT_763737 [Exidia glandulosa HHB12029]
MDVDSDAFRAVVAGLAQGLQDLQLTKYIYGSALTILVWDWCLTFEDERETIWRKRTNLLQVLYYLNRYGTFVFTVFNVISVNLPSRLVTDARYILTSHSCEGWLHVSLSAQTAAQWLVTSAIVTYRVRALYQSNRMMKVGIVVVWALTNIGIIVLTIVNLIPDKIVAELPFGLRACHSIVDVPLIFTPFLPGLAYDILAFSLALWKIYDHASTTSTASRNTGAGRSVYSLMAFDSALYFVIMSAATLVNIFIQLPFTRDTLRIMWDPMLMALGSTMCSRMVLNLKVAGSRRATETTTGSDGWSYKMSHMPRPDAPIPTYHVREPSPLPPSFPLYSTQFRGEASEAARWV